MIVRGYSVYAAIRWQGLLIVNFFRQLENIFPVLSTIYILGDQPAAKQLTRACCSTSKF